MAQTRAEKLAATKTTPTGDALSPAELAGHREAVVSQYASEGKANPYTDPTNPSAPMNAKVDTTQPSPQKAAQQATAGLPGSLTPPSATDVAAGIVNFDAKTGTQLAPGATTVDALGNVSTQGQKFKQAFQQTTASGVPAPATQGAAAGAMPKPDAPQAPSPIGAIMETDKNFDSILTNFDDWFSPPKQKQSLLQEYKSMEKTLGISAINEELINAKRIIEGTEDDIRAEVTAAGGFASDSQVLALANARNKSLVKNYNYLLESRDSAMTQLNTMMNLSIQDRKMAEDEFDRKLNFAFKVQEFQERAKTNASSQLNKIVENIGYGGLLAATNGNAYEQGIIEKTLGLGAGGLAKAASYVKPLSEMDKLELEGKKLSNAKLRRDLSNTPTRNTEIVDVNGRKVMVDSDTGETIKEINTDSNQNIGNNLVNPTTGKVDPRSQIASVIKNSGAKTDDKLKLTGAVVSAIQALAEGNPNGKFEGLGFGQIVPNIFLGQKGQSNRTNLSALEGTVESWMTGASVAEDQAKRIKRDMIPKTGDSDGQVSRKLNALANYMMNYTAGTLATQGVDWTPQPVDFFSPVIVTSPKGEEIEITN